MTFSSILLIIAVVVVLGCGLGCLNLILDNQEKSRKLDKRMARLEKNLGSLNNTVSEMPGKMEASTRNMIEAAAAPPKQPVFRAPEIQLEDIIDHLPDDLEDVFAGNSIRVESEPSPQTEPTTPPAEQVAIKAENETINRETESEITEIDEMTLNSILEGFEDFGEIENTDAGGAANVPTAESNSSLEAAPQQPEAKADAEPFVAKLDERFENETPVEAKLEERFLNEEKIVPEVETRLEPDNVETPKPEPIRDVVQRSKGWITMEVPSEPVQQAKTIKPITMEVPDEPAWDIPKEQEIENNVLPKTQCRVRNVLSESAADSALDIYFINGKFTPQESQEPSGIKTEECVAQEEECDYGRSGKKYTVSELEALIRD